MYSLIVTIVIFVLLLIEATIIWNWFKWTNERKEREIDTYIMTTNKLRETIKMKNNIIKELQDEIERRDNKRLRKNH